MSSGGRRTRPWGPLRGPSDEANAVAQVLRGWLDRAGIRMDDALQKLTPEHFADKRIQSRSTMSERLAGVGLRHDFVEAIADVCSSSAADRDRLLAEAEAARQHALAACSGKGAGSSAVEAELILVQQRSLAVSDKLVRAMERAAQLERERNDANQMVLVLLAMVDKLHRDIDALVRDQDRLRASPPVHTELEQVHERLSRSEQQRISAETELKRARAERQKADQLAEEAAGQVRLLSEELDRLRGEVPEPAAEDRARPSAPTPDVQNVLDGAADDIDLALIKAARHLDDRADRLDQLAGELHLDNQPDNPATSDVTSDNSLNSEKEKGSLPSTERGPNDFEAFHRMHYPAYLAWASTYLNNNADAEASVSAAFEELLRNWPKVLRMKNPATYAWHLMRTRVIEFAEAHGRGDALIDSSFETIALREAIDPVGQLEESFNLFHAIGKLPEQQRDIVVLMHLHGNKASEAADHLGINHLAARHIERQARINLRRYLGLAGR